MNSTTSSRRFWRLGAVAIMALLLVSCAVDGPDTEIQTHQQPIVNGSLETGWPGVGALTIMHPAYGWMGSFCTAARIGPQWLLTAAHCLDDDVGQVTLTPGVVRFYTGADADNPSPSDTYEVDAFYINPNYTAGAQPNSTHDLALVHLTSAPPASVTTYTLNSSAMSGGWVGYTIRYIGYGVSNGSTETGGGIKRMGENPIDYVDNNYYRSDASVTGVCFGDSGGPGFRYTNNNWYLVGVNSTVAGTGGDPCLGYGNHMRVDAYAGWITGITGGALPSCQNDPNMCYCAAACQANGTCNNTACEVLDCADMNMCFNNCSDDACYVDCYLEGTAQARVEYDAIMQCAYDNNCHNAADWSTCVSNNCQAEVDTCFAASTGTASCEDMVSCDGNCTSGDQSCYWACYESGTGAAQGIYDAMYDCFSVNCSQYTGTQWNDCIWQQCVTELETCMPPAGCDIAGGDCAAGTACYPTAGSGTDCYTSDEVGLGGTCDPNLTDRLSCDDGMLCASWMGNTCVQMCQDDLDCLVNEVCDMPVFSGITDIGWCNCVDADNDGECLPDDCDDNDPQTHHGAAEACDGVDNNCDGTVDEGCASCTDLDADTYCDDVDCDDNDAEVNPGAAERCGDNVDNDCDGQVDEGCATCDDFDADGYCFEVDCDDNDASAYPGAVEACDGVDNDCDGQVDEGCSGDVDLDGDGVPASQDCDDEDSRRFPGAPEVCDGVDNDCDGFVDETCGGAADRGGCNTTGQAPAPAPLLLGLLGLLGLLLRRRR